jgi:hypothetical protein
MEMKKIKIKLVVLLLCISIPSFSDNNDCKLKIGTNLSGISDWMTEMPFVDMMHNARTWGTRNKTGWVDGWKNEWNTELADSISKDENGYPLEVPFFIEGKALEDSQIVFTVWAWLRAWQAGVYTCFYDGEGELEFGANGEIISFEPGKLKVKIEPDAEGGFLEMKILRSKRGNHIRNIRLIMPEQETTYTTQPFNPRYLEMLKSFKAIRFMDWGQTNNWGHDNAWTCADEPSDTILSGWDERSKMTNYTWATNKGVPYEMMCDLCNALGVDMWVCMPHCASDEYIREGAKLIRNRLNPTLHIYTEYGNENWNWMFGQTQWLNTFFCEGRGKAWPEGIVDRVQNHLDIWTEVFADDPTRITRVAGVQTAWQDVANRVIRNLNPKRFDAVAVTGYFGLSEEGDAVLDELGTSATVADVARFVRKEMKENEIGWIESDYKELGIPLGKEIIYYEAGQHITPTPFGEEPSYSTALLDIQRDTALYNIYMEWFGMIEELIPDGEQALYMNFSFVGDRSARYGSWGILETLDQDTSEVYAPKYQALMEQIGKCSEVTVSNPNKTISDSPDKISFIKRAPKEYTVLTNSPIRGIFLYDQLGRQILNRSGNDRYQINLTVESVPKGIYILMVKTATSRSSKKVIID